MYVRVRYVHLCAGAQGSIKSPGAGGLGACELPMGCGSPEEQCMLLTSETSLQLRYKALLNPKPSKHSGILPTIISWKMHDQYVCKLL